MKKIKILQVNKYYYPWIGGIETVIKQISEGISQDFEVKVLVCNTIDKPFKVRIKTEKTNINGVEVERAGSFGEIAKVPLSLKFVQRFKALSKDADIVHIHVPFPLGDIACLLSGYKGKVVIWWHSDVVRQKKALILYKPIMEAFLKRADLIIVSADGVANGSQYLKPYLNKCKTIHFGLEKRKYDGATEYLKRTGKYSDKNSQLQVRKFAVDYAETEIETSKEKQNSYAPERRSELEGKNQVNFLFMGRLVYYKGCTVLIDAFSKLKGDVKLTIIGGGSLYEELNEKCKRLGISDKVDFAGKVKDEDLPKYYEDADVFVLPSTERSEAFALVQLEAMAYGMPVINTWLKSGVPEVSLHKETGLTVKPEDVDGLSEAMQWMIDNPKERARLGQNARKRLETEFTEEKMISELKATYKELLGNKQE